MLVTILSEARKLKRKCCLVEIVTLCHWLLFRGPLDSNCDEKETLQNILLSYKMYGSKLSCNFVYTFAIVFNKYPWLYFFCRQVSLNYCWEVSCCKFHFSLVLCKHDSSRTWNKLWNLNSNSNTDIVTNFVFYYS